MRQSSPDFNAFIRYVQCDVLDLMLKVRNDLTVNFENAT